MPPSAPPVPLLRLDRLRRGDGRAAGSRDISLDLDRGELLTLLGPSGCGKTAVLSMLAGFERPASGQIILDGRVLSRTPPHRREIGVMFHPPCLFAHMNVGENLAFPLRMRGRGGREQRERVGEMLGLLGLEGLAEHMPAQLSRPERRRAALARVLVAAPRLVLLDDPLAGLDPEPREQFRLDIRRLQRLFGVAMLVATRDRADALALSDRIAVLSNGAVRQLGAPQAIYDEPADAAVARLIGETNLLPGRLERVEDEAGVVRLAGGQLIEGVLVQPISAGAACVMSVRPERIATSPGLVGEADVLPATLVASHFEGDHARLRFAVENGPEIVVRRPAGTGLGGLAPGRQAALAWQPHHGRIFLPES